MNIMVLILLYCGIYSRMSALICCTYSVLVAIIRCCTYRELHKFVHFSTIFVVCGWFESYCLKNCVDYREVC